MHRFCFFLCCYAFTSIFAIAPAQKAAAQYLPGVYDPYLSWGAYPSVNAAAASRTIYAQRSAAQRQSLAQVQQRHQSQNRFLMSQSRGQESFAAENTRAASEAWIRANRPPQAAPYVAPLPAGSPTPAAPLPVAGAATGTGTSSIRSYDQIIDWPSLLRDSIFRTPRVRIETIMTKAEPGGAGLSENDYQQVVMAVDRMKGSLERMAERLNAAEYIGVVNYLDELTKRAHAAVKQ